MCIGRRVIVDAEKYIMVELADLAWGRKVHLGLNLNEEPMEGNDVDDRPTRIFKLPQAHEYAQLLLNSTMEHSSKFCRCHEHVILYDILNNMSISHII